MRKGACGSQWGWVWVWVGGSSVDVDGCAFVLGLAWVVVGMRVFVCMYAFF